MRCEWNENAVEVLHCVSSNCRTIAQNLDQTGIQARMTVLVQYQQAFRHQVISCHRFMQVKWNSELPYAQQPAHCYLADCATELQGITPHPLPHDYTLCKIPSFCVGGQCDENPRIPAHPLYAFH